MKNRIIGFDLIRALSALMVCASHLRNVMFLDRGEIKGGGPLVEIFYLMTGLGHQAVMVFFVLSGFLVGGSVMQGRLAFSWPRFALARLSRLWVVLLPALLFTGVVDHFLLKMAPGILEGIRAADWNSGPSPDKPWSSSFTTLVGNLLFLQTIEVPVFGTNSPLWSLANEFWYYLIFPLCLQAFGWLGQRSWQRSLPAFVLLAGIGLLLPVQVWIGFVIWLMGVVVSRIQTLQPRASVVLMMAGGALFAVACLASKSGHLSRSLADVLVGATFALLALGVRDFRLRLPEKPIVFLSDLSFTLYLFHFPFVMLIGGTLLAGKPLAPDLKGLLLFAGWMGAILLMSAMFWWMFESRTARVREAIGRRLCKPDRERKTGVQ